MKKMTFRILRYRRFLKFFKILLQKFLVSLRKFLIEKADLLILLSTPSDVNIINAEINSFFLSFFLFIFSLVHIFDVYFRFMEHGFKACLFSTFSIYWWFRVKKNWRRSNHRQKKNFLILKLIFRSKLTFKMDDFTFYEKKFSWKFSENFRYLPTFN